MHKLKVVSTILLFSVLALPDFAPAVSLYGNQAPWDKHKKAKAKSDEGTSRIVDHAEGHPVLWK
ncbi:MAG: hypothetical protein ACREDR_48830, partial [Blastocatellia bacterium]